MKRKNKQNGYSTTIASEYIDLKQAIYSISTKLEPVLKFENKRPTGEIIAYRAWFSQKGLPPFSVKFTTDVDLPGYMSIIQFDDLQACEVGNNVYFKASDLKEIK
ncbi:TPA: hypothetical protein ACGO4I_001156 [Streptococcus suis]